MEKLSDIPEEKEFLIKPNARFKVLSITEEKGVKLVSLEVSDYD